MATHHAGADSRPVPASPFRAQEPDWTVVYVDVPIGDLPIRGRWLMSRSLPSAADPRAERLHPAATGDTLRRTPFRPYPTADDQGREVRAQESRG